MKINKAKNKKPLKILVIFLSVAVFLAAGYAAVASIYGLWPLESISQQESVEPDNNTAVSGDQPQLDTGEQRNDPLGPGTSSTGDEDNKPVRDQTDTGQDGSNLRTVSVFVTDASQYGDIVEVRAYADEVASKGSCVVTLKKSGETTVKRKTALINSSTTTVCKTVNIPVSSFSSKGEWTAVITYQSNSGEGVSDPQVVEVR